MEGNRRGKQKRSSNPRRESCLFRAQNGGRCCCCIAARITPWMHFSASCHAIAGVFYFLHEEPIHGNFSSFQVHPDLHWCPWRGSGAWCWSIFTDFMKRQWSLMLICLPWWLWRGGRGAWFWIIFNWYPWRWGAEELDPHLSSIDVHEQAEELDPHLSSIDVHQEAKERDTHLPWCPWRSRAWFWSSLMSMKRAEVDCNSSVKFWIHQKAAQMHPILNDLLVRVRIIAVSPSPVPWVPEFLQGMKNFWTPEFHELLQSSLQEYEECFQFLQGWSISGRVVL